MLRGGSRQMSGAYWPTLFGKFFEGGRPCLGRRWRKRRSRVRGRRVFILLFSVPAVSRCSLAAQETTVTITTTSGDLWGHLLLCMYLWCCSLVHSLSASKDNWIKRLGPMSIMGLLSFLNQVGSSFCPSLQVRGHHQSWLDPQEGHR